MTEATPPINNADPNTLYDCTVVGAGPAGLTAAIYLQRFHRTVMLIDAGGSRAMKISRSHNCPGFPDGVSGPDLLARLRQQLERFGGRIVPGEVFAAEKCQGFFEITLSHPPVSIRTRTLLLCTGVIDKLPALPGIQEVCAADLLRQCPICDGHEYTDRSVAVLGDTAHADREADFLRDFASSVTRLRLSCESGDAHVRRLSIDGQSVSALMSDGSTKTFDVVYAALGVTPRIALAAQLGAQLDKLGSILVDAHCNSNVPGLYAAGDVVSALDQIAVAFGHAAIAATAIHNALRKMGVRAERGATVHAGPL